MADELKQSQLARIVAPAITDVKYAEGMADAFDKINDNFKKIASLPFLQGVQGDSYQLEEYKIWNDDWTITEDGKVLLKSIFGRDVTEDDDGNINDSFEAIKSNIGENLNGASPIDFFGSGSGEPLHNTLYFYVIKDDANNVIEKQLGQFYYFIDGRIKNIGTVYGDKTSSELLSTFNDYTGFYQYRYNPKSYEQKYLRIDILPSIYYDRDKNDICWKFNGNETGISAIGIEGQSGKDADLSIVLVEANPDDYSSEVKAEFNYLQKDNNANYGIYWDDDVKKIKEGKAIICCKTVDKNKDSAVFFNFAYGELIKGDDNKLNAYWNKGTMYSHNIDNMKITSYFYGMGTSENASAPHYLAIPSDSDRSTGIDLSAAHVIRNISTNSDSIGLEFVNTSDAFIATGGQKPDPKPISEIKDIKLSNYNLKVGNDTNVYITKDSVKIGPTSYIGPTGAVIGGNLEVRSGNLILGNKSNYGKTDIYSEVNIYDKNGINGIKFEEKNITAEGNITAKGNIIGESGANVGGDMYLKSNLLFGNNGEPGENDVHVIKINESEGVNRHLDIRTDGLYISKGKYGDYDKGGNDDCAVHQYIDGHLYVLGHTNIERGATVNGGATISGGEFVACGVRSCFNLGYNYASIHGKIFQYDCNKYDKNNGTFAGDVCILGYDSNGELKNTSVNMYYMLKDINGDNGTNAVIGFGENFPANSIVLLSNYTGHGLDFIRYVSNNTRLVCHENSYPNCSNIIVILGEDTTQFTYGIRTYKLRKPLYYINLGGGTITDNTSDKFS